MHRSWISYAVASLTVAVLLFSARPVWAGCAKDTDCKGDRICQAGQCVSATPSAPPPAATGGSTCTKDTDCKGDRICSGGQCVAPAGGAAPAPAPVPVQPAPAPVPTAPATAAPAPAGAAAPGTAPGTAAPGTAAPAGTQPGAAPAEGAGAAGTTTVATGTSDQGAGFEHGFSLGARLGYGIPLGSLQQNDNLSDETSGMLPIWIDAGYLFTPNIFVGLYFQYGFAFISNNAFGGMACSMSGVSCSGHDIRLGGEFHYHILPQGPFDPWVGAGIGYEWASESASVMNVSASQSVDGFEFFNLQAGGDYKVSPTFGVGPFLAFTFAQFSNYNQDTSQIGGAMTSGSITNKTLHEWLMIGARAVFDIPLK